MVIGEGRFLGFFCNMYQMRERSMKEKWAGMGSGCSSRMRFLIRSVLSSVKVIFSEQSSCKIHPTAHTSRFSLIGSFRSVSGLM